MTGDAAIYRKRQRPFVQVPRSTIRDVRLTLRARGLLAYMLDRPPEWRFSADAIYRDVPEGRAAVQAALRELRAAGYYRVIREHRPNGKFRMITEVSEEPVEEWGDGADEPLEPDDPAEPPAEGTEGDGSTTETGVQEPAAGNTTSGMTTSGKPPPLLEERGEIREEEPTPTVSPAAAGAAPLSLLPVVREAPAPPTPITSKRRAGPDPVIRVAQQLASRYYDAMSGMANHPAVAGIVRKALLAGYSVAELEAALDRLAASNRAVTVDSLRVEARGMAPHPGSRSNAGRAFDLAATMYAEEAAARAGGGPG